MAGGWIQAALLGSLSGKGSLPPWRWMFIVVSVMTIPFALFGECFPTPPPPPARFRPRINAPVTLTVHLGWFAIPDLPHHRSARFLTEEEKEYAVRRLGESRKTTWDLTVFRRVLLSWQFWLLPTVFMRECPPSRNSHSSLTASSLLPVRSVTDQQRDATLE